MTIVDAVDRGTDAELDAALAAWRVRNPDATLAVVRRLVPMHLHARLVASQWRVHGCPIDGWVTGA